MIGWIEQAVDLFKEKPAPRVVQSSLFYSDREFGLSDLPFDMLIDESHFIDFDVTEHAVENGASVADHITKRLRKVSITGFFTNHPIKGKTSGWVEDGKIQDEPDEIEIEGLSAIENDAKTNLKKLVSIADKKEPVTLYTSLEDFELQNKTMVIGTVSYDRGPDDGESIKFKMTLREIRRASLESVYVNGAWNPPDPPETKKPAQKKMSKKKKKGKKSAVEKVSQTLVKDGKNPKVFQPK